MAIDDDLMRYFQVQQLLHHEAKLLDKWQLREWLELFTDDGCYFVPPTNVSADEADPAKHLYYIADNHTRLEERVIRLEKRTCHSEQPRSKIQHLISNILLEGEEVSGELLVSAGFHVFRTKNGRSESFVGSYQYVLREVEDELKIAKKTCNLALDGLRPQGKISILL